MPSELWGDLVFLVCLVIALGCASCVSGYVEERKVDDIETQSHVTVWLLWGLVIAMGLRVVFKALYFYTGGLPCTLGY